jgi:HlyD family secretion protein
MTDESATAVRPKAGGAGKRIARIGLGLLVIGIFVGIPVARVLLQPDATVEPDPPAPVVLAPVVFGDAEQTARYSGNLTPETSTAILPKVGGRVTAVEVGAGQSVAAGDVIARIEDEVLRLQVAQARAAFDAATAQYRQAERGARTQQLQIARADIDQATSALATARSNLDRTERLFEADAVSRREYEEAQDRFQAAETQVENARRRLDLMEVGASDEELAMARANAEAAERRLELAQLQLDYASVTTPVAGTVASVLVEAGEMVGVETPLAVVVNDRLIYAKISVPERLYGDFLGREGNMPVRVFPEAYREREPFSGTVSAVATTLDARSRTFEVEVAIPNDDGRLRPGMYVNAFFVLESYTQVAQIPDSAVYRRDGRDVGFVVEDGVATMVPLRVLDIPGPMSVVEDGLHGTERIIVEGAAFIADGDRVEVVADR